MVFHRITLLEYTTIYIFFLLSWDVLVFFHLLLLFPPFEQYGSRYPVCFPQGHVQECLQGIHLETANSLQDFPAHETKDKTSSVILSRPVM